MFGTEPFIFCILLLALSMLARFPCDDDVDDGDNDDDGVNDDDDDDDDDDVTL